jgi:hypothetical protein
MAMAALQKSPIFVNQTVWDEVEDMTPLLEKLQKPGDQQEPPASEESE